MDGIKEINELKDEVGTLVTGFQEKHEKLETEGKQTSENLEEMKTKFEELSQKAEDLQAEMATEAKAREELELAVARKNEDGNEGGEVKSTPEYLDAFGEYMRKRLPITEDTTDGEFKGMVDSLIERNLSDAEYAHVKTMLVGSNPDGGYLAPVEMLSKISKRIFETSPMRQLATVITTANEAVEMPLDDGQFSSGWVGEVDSRPDTDTSKIGMITIPSHEQYAMPVSSQKALDDVSINLESFINGKVSEKFSRLENTGFVTGDGNKKPTGFLSYANWATLGIYQRDALETRPTAAASVFDGDDFIQLQTDLLEYYQANATWLMSRKTWAAVLELKDAVNGNYLLNPAMLFQGVLGMQLLGKPVRLFSDMPAKADSAVPVAYGDFREGYTIVDRIGIRILRDPYTSKGFVKFYTTKRVGGAVTNYQAIKRLAITAAG
jgi:HK97 family phage major capsid protein